MAGKGARRATTGAMGKRMVSWEESEIGRDTGWIERVQGQVRKANRARRVSWEQPKIGRDVGWMKRVQGQVRKGLA